MGVFLGPGPSAQMHELLELFMPLDGDIAIFLLSTIGNSIDVLEGGPTEADVLRFVLLEEDLRAKTKRSWELKKAGWGLEQWQLGNKTMPNKH